MKRTIIIILCLCMMLCFTACESNDPSPMTTEPSTVETTAATTVVPTTEMATAIYEAELASVSMPIVTETKYSDTQTLISYYSYQDVSIILPDADVSEAITLDMLNRIDTTTSAAADIHTAAENAYNRQDNWHPYFYTITHRVTRFDQNVLSFYGTEVSFDGSPRSATAAVSVNYDLTTGQPLGLQNILYEDYSADALCDLIIESLTTYASGELYEDHPEIIRQRFSTNTPVDSWYFSNIGLCFYFAPYEIGAFSSGTIVAEIPYEKLSGFMKDAYFPAEQLIYSGKIKCERFENDDLSVLDDYTQFGEIILTNDAEKFLISVEGSVSDLRISLSSDNAQNEPVLVFASPGLGPTDAIIIEATAEQAAKITISYTTDGQTTTATP